MYNFYVLSIFFCQERHIENYTLFSSNISAKHSVRMFSAQIQSHY